MNLESILKNLRSSNFSSGGIPSVEKLSPESFALLLKEHRLIDEVKAGEYEFKILESFDDLMEITVWVTKTTRHNCHWAKFPDQCETISDAEHSIITYLKQVSYMNELTKSVREDKKTEKKRK